MKKQNDKGITLIALVITIIVLLILAGVSLRLIAGNEGILNRAESAVSKSNTESLKEEIELAISELRIAYYEDKERFASADEYIKNKLNGKKIPSGTIGLQGETLTLKGNEEGATAETIGNYTDGKVTINNGNSQNDGKVYLNSEEWTYEVDTSTNTATVTTYKGHDSTVVVPNYIKTSNGDIRIIQIGRSLQ